jgi:lipopolysaccharide transport system ATP-binding protein
MSSPIIQVEGLGKKFRLHHQPKERYTTLRDTLARKVKGFWKAGNREPGGANSNEDFWALKDVNFEVGQGEVVGIIGRNGAGKSTLLKVLSRITEPTVGRITLRGRVASLLEVGTGFHPELTGRENIFLNGAILGMTRAEIRAKFDEIVAFAEVERFLDTPVKHYSSGMYVRLAFAVAAHLEPEILVVDEVLAVGDAEFQKKCLGKMKEVSSKGRTVLFVSHQLDTIRSLCTRAIQLHSGSVKMNGEVGEVITSYLRAGRAVSLYQKENPADKPLQILSAVLEEHDALNHRLAIQVTINSESQKTCSLDVRLTDSLGSAVAYGSFGTLCSAESLQLERGINQFRFAIDTTMLAEGAFALSLDLTHPHVEYFDRAEQCLEFTISQTMHAGRTRALLQRWGYGSNELSLIRLDPPQKTHT